MGEFKNWKSLTYAHAETYCSTDEPDHWTSSQSVIQTYYDDFIMTGLTVEEDHGASAAVVAPNSVGSYNGDLWHLADTLQEVFLEAQLDSGSRFSVGDIDTSYTNWGISGLTVQEYFNEADQTELLKQMTGATVTNILPAGTQGDVANMLFVGEQMHRRISLGHDNISDHTFEISVNLSGMDVTTVGTLRLSPYVHDGLDWTNADFDTTVSALETDLTPVFGSTQLLDLVDNEALEDESLARAGAILLAQNYYTALYVGFSAPLDENGDSIGTDTLVDADHAKPTEPIVPIVERLMETIQSFYVGLNEGLDSVPISGDQLENVTNTAWSQLATSGATVVTALGHIFRGDAETSFTVALSELSNIYIVADKADFVDSASLIYTSKSSLTGAHELFGSAAALGLGAANLAVAGYFAWTWNTGSPSWQERNAISEFAYLV